MQSLLTAPARPAAIVAGLLLLATTATAQTAGVCTVARTEGAVSLSERGVGRSDVQPGQTVPQNARIETGADGRVRLLCDGGLEVIVGTDTELAVEGILNGGTRPFGLKLLDGVAGFLFNRNAIGSDGVQVRTPSAVAAVRSTEWVTVAERDSSAVFTRDGTVFVFGNAGGEPVRLGPGDGTDVPGSGIAGPVKRWGAARVAALADRLGPDW